MLFDLSMGGLRPKVNCNAFSNKSIAFSGLYSPGPVILRSGNKDFKSNLHIYYIFDKEITRKTVKQIIIINAPGTVFLSCVSVLTPKLY